VKKSKTVTYRNPNNLPILYKTDPNCYRCTDDPYVPHYNCRYSGNGGKRGHTSTHCTAIGCN